MQLQVNNFTHASFVKQNFIRLSLLCLSLLILSFSQLSIARDQSPDIAWEKISNGALILDVRTAEEFAAGHLEGAVNIPFEVVLTELTKQQMAKDTNIVLYCRSGRRSGIANDELVAAGFTQTYNGGGYQMLSTNKR
ncbi:rhodanese-like domain-containing protein [Shewanella donghaensis]|uniref:rhodanese-like domain-containing protein n=1 Tax=Shewanella donghaensis TaxID=238836 RepID=UPI0014566F99